DGVNGVAFSPDGTRIVSGNANWQVLLGILAPVNPSVHHSTGHYPIDCSKIDELWSERRPEG
ncbi:hypothetical protein RR21198_1494, partial [Rhodococcus rhodochrous ATCC 21198]